jgi:hypothetical protein
MVDGIVRINSLISCDGQWIDPGKRMMLVTGAYSPGDSVGLSAKARSIALPFDPPT